MLATIKTYALAGLGVITAVFAALFYREKAKRKEAILEGLEDAREIEHEAQDQLESDLKREEIERAKAINSPSDQRNGFS